MYAIFEDGTRQYRVSEGSVVRLDFRDVDVGTKIEMERVLLYQSGQDTRIGQPLVEGVKVVAEVIDHPTVKLTIQKFRRRKNYRRRRGQRQPYTAVRIRSILLPGQQAPAPESNPAGAEKPAPADKPEAAKSE